MVAIVCRGSADGGKKMLHTDERALDVLKILLSLVKIRGY